MRKNTWNHTILALSLSLSLFYSYILSPSCHFSHSLPIILPCSSNLLSFRLFLPLPLPPSFLFPLALLSPFPLPPSLLSPSPRPHSLPPISILSPSFSPSYLLPLALIFSFSSPYHPTIKQKNKKK